MSCEEYSSKNVAAVVEGNKKISLIPWSLPDLGENDVLLAVSAVGICGSDVKYWAYGACGRFRLNGQRMVIGHEASGTVAKVGAGVARLRAGDRVAIEPGVACRACEACDGGRYNLCARMRFCATPPVHGNLCRFYVHDADFCYKLPDSVSFAEGAMVEPLSVAIHSCRRADVKHGHRVVVFGAGPIGLLCGLVAKHMGATAVLIIDIDTHRLGVATEFGAADVTYCVTADDDQPEVLATKLRGLMADRNDGAGGGLPHSAFECSGADSSLKTAVHVVGPGGCVLLVGRGSAEVPLPVVKAGTFEIDIKGIFRYANTYPDAIDMVATGAIDVERFITHRYKLREAEKAFTAAADAHSRAIKVMISCSDDAL